MATATRPQSSRPKLAQLKTPMTSTFPSTFPSELSALSARTPLSAFPAFHSIKMEEGVKTPITPPSAYTDFLNKMQTPTVSEPPHPPPFLRNNSDASTTSNITVESISSTSTSSEDSSRSASPTSVPASETITPLSSTTTSSISDSTTKSPHPTALTPSPHPAFALPRVPASAPLNSTGRMRLHIPASPAFSIHELTSPLSTSGTPISATCTSSAIRSPFSARSHFDWDAAAMPKSAAASARYFDAKPGQSPRISKSGVRHVREIVTRTVTYSNSTPRMSPAPRGKRRRVGGVGVVEGKLKMEVGVEKQ